MIVPCAISILPIRLHDSLSNFNVKLPSIVFGDTFCVHEKSWSAFGCELPIFASFEELLKLFLVDGCVQSIFLESCEDLTNFGLRTFGQYLSKDYIEEW